MRSSLSSLRNSGFYACQGSRKFQEWALPDILVIVDVPVVQLRQVPITAEAHRVHVDRHTAAYSPRDD